MKHRIFITGEHGMIACAAAHYFLKEITQFELVNWAYDDDNTKTFNAAYKNSSLKELDIRSQDFIYKAKETKPSCIIHTAAYVNTDSCESEPKECIDSNVFGTWQVIEAAKQSNASIIFIGTTATYDPDIYDGNWIKESTSQNPKTIYGITKYASEQLILKYCQKFSIPYIVLRPCFAFGGIMDKPLDFVRQELYHIRDTSSNITKLIYNSIFNIIDIPKFTLSKNYLKDYMSVDDLGQAIYLLVNQLGYIGNECYNISLMKPNSWDSYLYMIEKELEEFKIEMCDYKLLGDEDYLKNHLVDSSLLRSKNWFPKWMPRNVIRDLIFKIQNNEFVFNEKALETHT